MPGSDLKATLKSPDTIATPEGDNEFNPDQPLSPLEDHALETPLGFDQNDETQAYKQDIPLQNPRSDPSKPRGLEKLVDEIARSEYM